MSERRETMPAARKGRIVVLILVVLGVAGAAGSSLYRNRARMRYAAELENGEPGRVRALHGLLQMNGLWSLAREYVYIPAALAGSTAGGSNYLRSDDGEAGPLHVVRAVEEEKAAQAAGGGEAAGAVFVFQASGKLLHAVKGARAYSLAAGQAGAAVALVAETEAAGAKYSTVTLVGKELRQALRVRGRFLLETMEGPVEPGAAAGGAPAAGAQGAPELPVFRYDAAARACRGPAGGPDKAWEVDRSASPGYSP